VLAEAHSLLYWRVRFSPSRFLYLYAEYMYDDVFYLLSLSESDHEFIWKTDQYIKHSPLFYIILVYMVWNIFETTFVAVFLLVSLLSDSPLDLEGEQEDLWFKFKYAARWGDSAKLYEVDDPRHGWWVVEPMPYLKEFCVNSMSILFLRLHWITLAVLFAIVCLLSAWFTKLIVAYVYTLVYFPVVV
jgi:hypothetical protein